MRYLWAALVLSLASVCMADGGDDEHSAIYLKADDFWDKVDGSKNWVVAFVAPWYVQTHTHRVVCPYPLLRALQPNTPPLCLRRFSLRRDRLGLARDPNSIKMRKVHVWTSRIRRAPSHLPGHLNRSLLLRVLQVRPLQEPQARVRPGRPCPQG